MSVRGVLKSKKFWGGAAAGFILGPWALSTTKQITGLGVKLPRIGNGG
jgi:maltose-binding protein MalE